MSALRMGAVIVVAVALAGCGSSDQGAGAEPPKPTLSSPASLSLRDVCPEVERALPKAYLPSAAKLAAFSRQLSEFFDQGDTETQNALVLLQEATDRYRKVADDSGQQMLEGDMAFLDGITQFAKRCKAAGSSALQ